MNNKLNNLLNKFFEENGDLSEEEVNEKLQEFMTKLNNGEIEYEETPMDKALDLLEQAKYAKSKKQELKYANQALKVCPECFDAKVLKIELEDDPIKRLELINKALEEEKDRLTEKGYFDKENIGHFYGIYETRPYLEGMLVKLGFLLFDGKMKLARDICLEIIKLNNNDNLGMRYMLMAIYAYLEEENEMLKVYKKYKEDSFEMLFPLFILYYKLGDDKKALEYLKKVNKANPNLLKLFKGTMKFDENRMQGYYQPGTPSEIDMYFKTYVFLLDTVRSIDSYVLTNSKK